MKGKLKNERILVAAGQLTKDEVIDFLKILNESEVRDFCKIELDYNDETCVGKDLCSVKIFVKEEKYGGYFLEQSLKDGMLRKFGSKFDKITMSASPFAKASNS